MIVRKVRPRFHVPVPFSPGVALERILGRLERPDCPCRVMKSEAHRMIELRVLKHERHFWSPALNVTVQKDDAGDGSVVEGLVGPNPNVWTLFAMLYMGLVTFTMFAAIFGMVQWSLDEWPWGLWVTAGLVLALALLYGLSQVGQRLAAPQTAMLRHVLEDALELPEAERAITDYDPYHARPASQ